MATFRDLMEEGSRNDTRRLVIAEQRQLMEDERMLREDTYRNEERQRKKERHELMMTRAWLLPAVPAVRTDLDRKGDASRRAQELESTWLEVRDLALLLEHFEQDVGAADAYLNLNTSEQFTALRKAWVDRRIEKIKRLEAL
jgi:NADH pyrophosphatase NudC (nudix superfamily)